MPAPIIDTELARVLYKTTDYTSERLAKRMGVSRQVLGDWIHGRRDPVPARRRAQLVIHLEAHGIPLFDDEGYALPVREHLR